MRTANEWHEQNDRVWDEKPPPNNPAFTRPWFLRCRDLVDSYRPDLLYFDNSGLPLGQAGLDIAAHYYNASLAWHDGKLEAVVNAKVLPPERRAGAGGRRRARLPRRHRAAAVADRHLHRRLALQPLDLRQPPVQVGDDGDPPPVRHRVEERQPAAVRARCAATARSTRTSARFSVRSAAWMGRNGEAIHGTRPWRTFGEGPTRVAGGMFSEHNVAAFHRRRTSASPPRAARSMPSRWAGRTTACCASRRWRRTRRWRRAPIERVEALGSAESLPFQRSRKGLEVRLPEGLAGSIAIVLKIRGNGPF